MVLLFSEPKYAMETCLPFSLGTITKINRYRYEHSVSNEVLETLFHKKLQVKLISVVWEVNDTPRLQGHILDD